MQQYEYTCNLTLLHFHRYIEALCHGILSRTSRRRNEMSKSAQFYAQMVT